MVLWFTAGKVWGKQCVYGVCLQQKYPVKELATDGKEVIWDSKRGFILPSHVVSYAGVVYCQTTIRNETYQSLPYIVAVVGKQKKTKCLFAWSSVIKKYDMTMVGASWLFASMLEMIKLLLRRQDCICWDCKTVWCEISCPGLKRTMLHPARPLLPFPLPQDTRSMTSPWVHLMRG